MKLQEAAAALRRNIAIRGNSDAGVSLRSTRTSEISSFVKNCNLAETHSLRKELNIWHKDTNFEVRKLTKRQDEMYKTLLKLSRTKKEIKTFREEKKKDAEQRDRWKNSSRRRPRRNKVSMFQNPNAEDLNEKSAFDYLKIEHLESEFKERYPKLLPINNSNESTYSTGKLTMNNIRIFNQLTTNYEQDECSYTSNATPSQSAVFETKRKNSKMKMADVTSQKKKLAEKKDPNSKTVNKEKISVNLSKIDNNQNTKVFTFPRTPQSILKLPTPQNKSNLFLKIDLQETTKNKEDFKFEVSNQEAIDVKAIEAVTSANKKETNVKGNSQVLGIQSEKVDPVRALSLTSAHLQKPSKNHIPIFNDLKLSPDENDNQPINSPQNPLKDEFVNLLDDKNNYRTQNAVVTELNETQKQKVKQRKMRRKRIKLKTIKSDPSEELNTRSSIEVRPGHTYNVTIYKKIPKSNVLEEDTTSWNTTVDVAKYFNLASHKERLRRERLLDDAREKEAQQRRRVDVFLHKLSEMEIKNKDQLKRKKEVDDERMRLQRRMESIKRGPPKYGVGESLNVPSYVRKYVRPSLQPNLPQKLRKRSSWSVPSLFTLQAAAASRHVNSNLLKSSFNSSISTSNSFGVPDQSSHLVNINIEQYLLDAAAAKG